MSGRRPSDGVVIALDAMGGDQGPAAVLAGAAIALQHYPGTRFLLTGDSATLAPLMDRTPALAAAAHLRPAETTVAADEKPSLALRHGGGSSMRLAIDAVRDGEADCAVSAGNTGALMATAWHVLRPLPGIDRPAIASFFPTGRGESVLLDLGANVDCRPDHLVQFAVMGGLFARAVLGLVTPTIGLLNVGSEVLKGNETVKQAHARLAAMTLPGRYVGFVEGNDIPAGTADVIVTDGFTGNIALKTAEGTARLASEWLTRTLTSSLPARLGSLLGRSAFRKLRVRTDPRQYNGAMFLGLQGICVKSHGATDAHGLANAVGVAIDLVRNGYNEHLTQEIRRFLPGAAPDEPVPDEPAAGGPAPEGPADPMTPAARAGGGDLAGPDLSIPASPATGA